MFRETFGLGPTATITSLLFVGLVVLFALYWFFRSAPPTSITITSGPEGSIFKMNAEKYKEILARNGVNLKVLTSEGSRENLKRLSDPSFHVDIGFVQDGETDGLNIKNLISLGSISHAPILVFYRSPEELDLLSEFEGKRLAIGPEGSGTRSLALVLLAANGLPGRTTELLDLEGDNAAKVLLDGKVDAVFLMGESASVQNMRKLALSSGIRILDFKQAEGYSRRFVFLNELVLPMGSIDFGRNLPAHDIHLIGPTVELVARKGFHAALSDLFLEAARETHGKAGLFRKQGEFPAPQQHEFHISAEAIRYYKSGKSFLYRSLPFWLASLVNRILVVFVPMIVVLVPGLKIIPLIYRCRIMLRFYRWYRALMILEEELAQPLSSKDKNALLERLDQLEKSVKEVKVPAPFADQFYGLRGHISFVRERLAGNGAGRKEFG